MQAFLQAPGLADRSVRGHQPGRGRRYGEHRAAEPDQQNRAPPLQSLILRKSGTSLREKL